MNSNSNNERLKRLAAAAEAYLRIACEAYDAGTARNIAVERAIEAGRAADEAAKELEASVYDLKAHAWLGPA